MTDLIERLERAYKWATAENDHIEPDLVFEAIDALRTATARAEALERERDEAKAEVARYWTSADMKPWVEMSEAKGLGHFGKKLKGMFSRAMKAEDDAREAWARAEAAERENERLREALEAASPPTSPGEPQRDPKDQALIDRLRSLVDNQPIGDAVVLVQRQLFNKVVGRLAALSKPSPGSAE